MIDEMRTEQFGARLSDDEYDDTDRLDGIEWFGCLTGDCPHETQAECDVAILGVVRSVLVERDYARTLLREAAAHAPEEAAVPPHPSERMTPDELATLRERVRQKAQELAADRQRLTDAGLTCGACLCLHPSFREASCACSASTAEEAAVPTTRITEFWHCACGGRSSRKKGDHWRCSDCGADTTERVEAIVRQEWPTAFPPPDTAFSCWKKDDTPAAPAVAVPGEPMSVSEQDLGGKTAKSASPNQPQVPLLKGESTMTTTDFTQSFDARDWAAAFVAHAQANPALATDEGTMIGWFANALMRGYDECARKAPRRSMTTQEGEPREPWQEPGT